MDETFEVIQSERMNSSNALDILTGAFVLEFDIDVDKESVRAHAGDLRNLLRRYVAFQLDGYSVEGYSFIHQFARLQEMLERKGWIIFGSLTLRKSAPLAHLGDIPTAVFSLVKKQRVSRGAGTRSIHPLPTREQLIADKDPEHFVFWDDISVADVDAYTATLATAHDERGMHALLKSRPVLLVQSFTSGHGRWVYASKWLGKQHEVDFMIATKNSIGYEWTMIELEPPTSKPFQSKGKPTARLNEAIDQIKTWRTWIQSNIDYARREGGSEGLGLPDITPRCHSVILIGRRVDFISERQEWRRELRDNDGIEIHSYDWITENAEARLGIRSGASQPSQIDPSVSIIKVDR